MQIEGSHTLNTYPSVLPSTYVHAFKCHAFRDTEWSSTMEWRVASQFTICTFMFSEVVSSTGPLAKSLIWKPNSDFGWCSMALYFVFALRASKTILLYSCLYPYPSWYISHIVWLFVQAFFCFKAWHPTLTLISISEHVDKGGLPPPSGQTFCQVPS